MTNDRGPVPLRWSLERLLEGMGAPRIDDTKTIIDQWSEIVGPRLAERIEAVAVRGSELLVAVNDPAWASQVAWLEVQLLERIESLVGAGRITSVRVQVEPLAGS
ncbi:MAG: DUF721 domain-containing protein [Actinomycetota bacterium]|nr:DUF721 domain-containing protein [Actinomycetota bacterium]MEE3353836.1 DUF721 domain-containing protein [Actinomycetota bacterium]